MHVHCLPHSQVVINLPPSIQLLAMSATVRNPEDLGGWIGQVGAAAACCMLLLASAQ